MPGKDKTAKSGKSKKALEAEFSAALSAADNGEAFTCNASNTAKGGTSISVADMQRNSAGSGEIVRPTAVAQSEILSKKDLREAKKKAKQDLKAWDADSLCVFPYGDQWISTHKAEH